MYRSAARRLLSRTGHPSISHIQTSVVQKFPRFASTSAFSSKNSSYQNPKYPPPLQDGSEPSNTSSSESSPLSPFPKEAKEDTRRRETSGGSRTRAKYQDEQCRVLSSSIRHVLSLGWTEAAMIAGARDAGVSPSIIGSFPRKEASLVEFFMDQCLEGLIDKIDSAEDLRNLIPSERISKLARLRLELQAPFISSWPQALSIQSQPQNISTSLKQRAMLVDEIWHAAGDEAVDVEWYTKRAILGVIYSSTEVYMLTDNSPDFRDTWIFLDGRIRDAFDLKKSIQEAKYIADAVGAGMRNSLQGLMKGVFQG